MAMELSDEDKYAAFKEKVKRTVYFDNLSPLATDAVMKTALNQFGNVLSVQFIPNYIGPNNMAAAALVEMETEKQAIKIIEETADFPFMITGMPRPVRAFPAEIEMFEDRPRKPGRTIQCRWLEEKDPDFVVAQQVKDLVKKHATEASFMLKQQLAEEERLHNKHGETLKANHKKYELIEKVLTDGSARKLGSCYNIKLQEN